MIRFIATLLVIVIGVIYWPLNAFYLIVQKWHFKMKEKDKVVYYVFSPFYWILVAIVSAISLPFEKISELAGH